MKFAKISFKLFFNKIIGLLTPIEKNNQIKLILT